MHNLRRAASFKITPVQPYNFELTVKKPAGWHWFTPFEEWKDGTVRTGFWYKLENGKKLPLGIRACAGKYEIAFDVFAPKKLGMKDLMKIRAMLVKALGAEEDITQLYKMMRKDRVLKHLVRRLYGMREAWGSDIFPSLTLAVLLQMAPIKRSQSMWDCLIRKYGEVIKFDNAVIQLWPTEESIASAPRRELEKCKLGYRAKNLVKLANQLVKGFPSAEELSEMTPEESKRRLMELFGVGEYSASFADPHSSFSLDVWSVKIFHRLIFGRPVPKGSNPRELIDKTTRAAEKLWGKWRGYVMTYVLNDLPYLEEKFGIKA